MHSDDPIHELSGELVPAGGTRPLERVIEINVHRPAPGDRRERAKSNWFRCGNCMAKLAMTGDPETDHHTAMRHRIENCQRVAEAEDQHRELIDQYGPHQLHQMQERARTALLPAPAPPAAPRGSGRPWWRFW